MPLSNGARRRRWNAYRLKRWNVFRRTMQVRILYKYMAWMRDGEEWFARKPKAPPSNEERVHG